MRRRSVEILFAAAVLFVSESLVMGVIEFNDGGVWNIDYIIHDDVWIDYESPGMGTTVNILDGVRMPAGCDLKSFEKSTMNIIGGSTWRVWPCGNSQVNVFDGSIESLNAFDSSKVAVSGGWIENLSPSGNSQVTVSGGHIHYARPINSSEVNVGGGTIDYFYSEQDSQVSVSGGALIGLHAIGNSRVTVSGGSLSFLNIHDMGEVVFSGGAIKYNVAASGDGRLEVSGGTINYWLSAEDKSEVIVSGGSIGGLNGSDSSQIIVSGGLFGKEVGVWDNAVCTINGSDFTVDGTSVGFTELTSIFGLKLEYEPYRRLTGILSNGDLLDNDFRIGHSAKIILIPEPATLLFLGIGGLMLRRRRHEVF